MPNEEFITTKEAAEIAKVTASQIRRLLIEGKIEGKKFGHVWAVDADSLKAYIASQPRPGPKKQNDA